MYNSHQEISGSTELEHLENKMTEISGDSKVISQNGSQLAQNFENMAESVSAIDKEIGKLKV